MTIDESKASRSGQNTSEDLSPQKIASLTKLAQTNFTKFAFTVQEMSSDVRVKLIEQMPEFRTMAKNALNTLSDSFNKTLDSNDKSEAHVYETYKSLTDSLVQMLEKDDLSLDEQLEITNKINEASREVAEIDKSNKQFKLQMFGKIVTGTIVVAGLVVAAVAGGKMALDSNDPT